MVADVEVDVEVVVLDPVGQVQAERHLDQAAAERGELVQRSRMMFLVTSRPAPPGAVVGS